MRKYPILQLSTSHGKHAKTKNKELPSENVLFGSDYLILSQKVPENCVNSFPQSFGKVANVK